MTESIQLNKTRKRYIDQAKGLGILCITFLHYENGIIPWQANIFIGSFMITIFYVIAGWVMAMKDSNLSTRELVKRRLRSLGLPYLYWSCIILFFDTILWATGYYDASFVAKEAYKTILLRGVGTLWFLPALFAGEIVWNWLRNKNVIWTIVTFVLVLVYNATILPLFNDKTTLFWKLVQIPFITVEKACTAVICVSAGYFAFKIFHKIINASFNAIIGILLSGVAYICANYTNWIFGRFAIYVWAYAAPIIGPVGILLLLRAIDNWKILDYFDYWGRNSLSLMVTHYSIVQVLITIFVTHVLKIEFFGWITIVAFLISMPIQYLITCFLNRKYKWLLNA